MNHSLETRNWMIPADEFLDHPVDEQWFPVVPLNHPTESSTRKASQNIPCFIPSNHGTAVLMKICFNSKEVFSRAWRCRDGFLNWDPQFGGQVKKMCVLFSWAKNTMEIMQEGGSSS